MGRGDFWTPQDSRNPLIVDVTNGFRITRNEHRFIWLQVSIPQKRYKVPYPPAYPCDAEKLLAPGCLELSILEDPPP